MIKITYFVHGTTTNNEKDLTTGWVPGELSKLGIQQSKDLGKTIVNKRFDVVFSSDLKRAVDSANIAFGEKYKIITDRRLREANYGDLNETSRKKIKAKLTDYIDKPFPNGECYKDVEKRISDFLNFLKENYNEKHVSIVSHQAPQLALDVLIKGKTWEQAIDEDWHNIKAWKPGWEYVLK